MSLPFRISASLRLPFSFSILLVLCAAGARAQRPELIVQTGHADNLAAVAFSPDGKVLASASSDGVIKLWDVSTGAELRTIGGQSASVFCLAYSPNGKLLAAGIGFHVTLFDAETGAELRALKGHTRSVRAIAFSPDGQRIAGGSGDDYYGKGENLLTIWDVGTGALLHTLMGHTKPIWSVAFSPDGRTVASGGEDEKIKLWETATGKLLRTLEGHSASIMALSFSADGSRVVSCGRDRTIKFWDARTGRQLESIPSHPDSLAAVTISPDGKFLASGSFDRTAYVWELATGNLVQRLEPHPGSVFALAFSPDGGMLASGGAGQVLKLWDAVSGRDLRTFRRRGVLEGSVAFSPDGKLLVGGGIGPVVKLWDLAAGQEPRTLSGAIVPRPHHLERVSMTDAVSTLAYSPDGKILASGNLNDTIELWDTARGQRLRALVGHTHMISSLAFSPDGKSLASTSNDATIRLWDVNQGRELWKAAVRDRAIWSIAFSPDGKLLASAGHDKTLRLWDARTGQQTGQLKGHKQEAYAVAFSPDGKILASADADNIIRLWDTATGNEVRQLAAYSMFVAFSADGKLLASGDDPGHVKLWEVATGKLVQTLKGHVNQVRGAAFSPDGKTFASAATDATIRLWEVETGRELLSLIALDEGEWLVVTPDGLFDGSAAAWNQILWRFSQKLHDVSPVEIFFNEFYHPGLLADVMAGKRPRAAGDISRKDRRQPTVSIEHVAGETSIEGFISRSVRVRIRVTEAVAGGERGSGAQDLRLFRNGLLVKVWRGDLLGSASLPDGCSRSGPNGMMCETSLAIVPGTNQLVAYAFNSDNIKSMDDTLSIHGGGSLKRQGIAYVLAVGVNEYANAGYNLKYAVADAAEFGAELKRQQERLGHFQRTEITALSDKDATKANILENLKQLAVKVQPEDAVIVYFAGHGTAAKDRFYLIPHDLGYMGERRQLDQTALENILAHSISDRELERAFEGMDAGQILLVIDACNSGQALEAEEKRRGPMNSKGLAQLAYEKGMYILTAAQSYQAAMEATRLGHGYLTYALVEEGLKRGAADYEPKDSQIVLREWLNYAAERVPQMQLEIMNPAQAAQNRILEQEEIAFVEGEEKIRDPRRKSLQRPRAFFRREAETKPFIVARP